jgi:hypothetical protein
MPSGSTDLTLAEKRQLFTLFLGRFLRYTAKWAARHGMTVLLRELWRTPEQAKLYAQQGKGITKSLHISSLAIDLLLLKDGKVVHDSAKYEPLGRYWERLHPLCCWGGRFTRPDGGHFSVTHGGVK